jgi:hypothetical protein
MKLTIYGEETAEYEGRLIGILSKAYFCNLIETPHLNKNIRTTRSFSFKNIYEGKYKNNRLAFSIKSVDFSYNLLISDILVQIQYTTDVLTCITRSNEFITIEK